jgi:hypothetical protein
VHATVKVLVYECCWADMVCSRNWPQADHVLAELRDEVRWLHWVSRWGQ